MHQVRPRFTTEDESTYSELELEEQAEIQNSASRQRKCRGVCTLETGKIIACLLLTVAALCLFVLVEEKHEELHICATSASTPFGLEIEQPRSDLFMVHLSSEPLNQTSLSISFWIRNHSEVNLTGVWRMAKQWDPSLLLRRERYLRHKFNLELENYKEFDYRILASTNSTFPIGITLDVISLHYVAHYEVAIATTILILLYVLIIAGWLPNAIASMMCGFLALGTFSQLHYRPSLEEVISKIDFETLGILFGMMIMVGIFAGTGFFEYVAIKTFKYSGGNMWYLTLMICGITAVLSAFLDSVTCILLVGPVTVKLCKVLDIPPKYLILAEVMISNAGGAATVIGDPPNIIIASNPTVKAAGVTFANFSLHVFGLVLITLSCIALFLWKFYYDEFQRRPNATLAADIIVWKRTLARFKGGEGEEDIRNSLEEYISNLEFELTKTSSLAEIEDLEAKYPIHDKSLFIMSSILLTLVIILFFLSTLLGLSLAWIAVTGALIHIILAGIRNVDEILVKVEWSTLIFFAALFILMETLDDLGLMDWFADKVISLIFLLPEEGNDRLYLATFLVVWIGGIASAFLDALPTTTTLLPIVIELSYSGNLDLRCLVWALVLGICLGANATVIGAPVNVVAVGLLDSIGVNITFLEFMKFGAPVAVGSLILTTGYTLIKASTGWY